MKRVVGMWCLMILMLALAGASLGPAINAPFSVMFVFLGLEVGVGGFFYLQLRV